MKILTTLAFVLVALLALVLPSRAEGDSCDRAWLASDWPTVAVECANQAHQFMADRQDMIDTNASMQSRGLEVPDISGDNWMNSVFAGIEQARVAVAYANLKKPTLSSEARQLALEYLSASPPPGYENNPLYRQEPAALKLVQSKTFVKDAPDSDSLIIK